jgi:hypothetical protein
MIVRLIGLPARETNSSHASSSPDPAQRQTRSFRDKDECRVVLVVVDILFLTGIGAIAEGRGTEDENAVWRSGHKHTRLDLA